MAQRARQGSADGIPWPRVVHAARTLAVSLLVVASLIAAPIPAHADGGLRARTADEIRAEARLFEGHGLARTDPAVYGYDHLPALEALRWADDVAAVARAWSDEMARSGNFRHNPDYSSQVCCWSYVGENIVWSSSVRYHGGPEGYADAMMQLWMDSPGHHANIRHEAFTEVGIGVSIGPGGGYATAVFRQARATAPASSATYPGSDPAPDPAPEPAPGPAPPVPDVLAIDATCPSQDGSRWFDDVTGSAVTAIDCIADVGITTGVAPRRFDPHGEVTRGQMAVFIERAILAADGRLPATGGVEVADVDADSPVGQAVDRLMAAGIVGGYPDGTFRPGQPVTRAQMSRFLIGALEQLGHRLPDPSRSWFLDVPSTSTAWSPVNRLADAGIAAGDGHGSFHPDTPVHRDQMARFLARWMTAAG